MSHTMIESFLNDLGVTKTIYAYIHPETKTLIEQILREERQEILDECEAAWTQRQDASHEDFLTRWLHWSRLDLNRKPSHPDGFPFAYPAAGASEGLRQIILEFAAQNPGTVLHSLYGDYEGARVYAASAGMASVQWNNVGEFKNAAKAGDVFYISDPSAIDGEPDWARLVELNEICRSAGTKILLDLTYVGLQTTDRKPPDYGRLDAVAWIIFSLSKPFGVYYWRIGGVYSRQEILGLKGNCYFKNLLSLRIGHRLMQDIPANKLAVNLRQAQSPVCDRIKTKLDELTRHQWSVVPSTVPLLVNACRPADGNWEDAHPLEKYLARVQNGTNRQPATARAQGIYQQKIHLRLCITPALTRTIRGRVAGDAPVQLRKTEK